MKKTLVDKQRSGCVLIVCKFEYNMNENAGMTQNMNQRWYDTFKSASK